MSQEEFFDRVMAIQRATKIFIESGLTENITHAFSAYQEIFAEREREIFLIAQFKTIAKPFDKYERPKCPDCGADMFIRPVPDNDKGIKTLLDCSSQTCKTRLETDKDIVWWMEALKKK